MPRSGHQGTSQRPNTTNCDQNDDLYAEQLRMDCDFQTRDPSRQTTVCDSRPTPIGLGIVVSQRYRQPLPAHRTSGSAVAKSTAAEDTTLSPSGGTPQNQQIILNPTQSMQPVWSTQATQMEPREDCQEEQSAPRNGCYAEEDEVTDQLMKQ